VIVVNPYDIVGLKKLVQFRGEDLVDPHIAAEITTGEFRQIQPVMENRPQHSVGVSIVIFLIVLFNQIDQHIRLMAALDRPDGDARFCSHLAAPSEPDSGMSTQDRMYRGCKSTRLIASLRARDSNAIGDQD
jgi:hypothetical protein